MGVSCSKRKPSDRSAPVQNRYVEKPGDNHVSRAFCFLKSIRWELQLKGLPEV